MKIALITAAFLATSQLALALPQVSATRPPLDKAPAAKLPPSGGGVVRPQLVTYGIGGNDNCASAATSDAISGPGTFGVNTTGASTGTPVGNCGAMGRDVWFYWTATGSGTTNVSTCGQVVADSVIAVWADGSPAGTCPTQLIVCLDDFCGLQTTVSFNAVAGTSYFFEFGSYNNGAGYNGTFTVAPPVPPPGNDDCTLPTHLVGDGPHGFSTVSTSTGTEGQQESLCDFSGQIAIWNDAWFTWTASQTARYQASLCGVTTFDTKLAVYAGSSCPSNGSALACNDDSCGLVSALCFNAIAGQTYLIQIGAYSPGTTGTGELLFTPQPPTVGGCVAQDDGTTENSVGLTAGGALAWMVGFGEAGSSTTIGSIETCFGSSAFPGGYNPLGLVTIAVWDDPNDDGNPTDGVLLASTSATILAGSIDTEVLQSIPFATGVVANGVFFVGAIVTHSPGNFPGPLDQSTIGAGCAAAAGGSWVAGATNGNFNLTNLAANDVAPLEMNTIGLPGHWLLRTSCSAGGTAATSYCFGDGTGTPCPCSNSGAAGHGCASSAQVSGAHLRATGDAIVGADTLLLSAAGMPDTSVVLYAQGTTRNSVVFGDGLSCIGGTMIRLGTKSNSGGASSHPGAGDPSISVRGLVPAGSTRQYQGWYRNHVPYCTADRFNLTNGVEVVWQ